MRLPPMPETSRTAARPDAWSELALLTPSAGAFALVAIGASLVLPLGGLGVDVCVVHRVSGLPCPGCGLTRAFIAVAHGDLSSAVALNPFVLVLFPLFVAVAAVWLAPSAGRARVEAWLRRRRAAVGRVYRIGVLAFVGFGAARFAWFLLAGERFP